MHNLLVIGLGTGNPEHMTVQAINALNRADIVLIPRKGETKADLAEVRRDICRRFLSNPQTKIVEFDLPARDPAEPSYRKRVDDWHGAIADIYHGLIKRHVDEHGTIAFLVWGDPSLYDSTLRILARLEGKPGFAGAIEVIPGITSIQALTASHKVALNTVGGAVHVTTGRNIRKSFPDNADSVVVMLDDGSAPHALPAGDHIVYWGAYLGSRDEILISGKLGEVADEISQAREAARKAHGWIMDTWLVRRARQEDAASAPDFDAAFRGKLDDLFRWRRDVRRFRSDPIDADLLREVLSSAALAPSVGFSQPWRLVLVEDQERRAAIRENFRQCNREALADYAGDRAGLYASLKLAGLDEAPVHLAVFADRGTASGHGLGRKTMPEMLHYSAALAVHTLWLSARARGIGVGWVSILDPVEVSRTLDVPECWDLVAYLCVGYPQDCGADPELLRIGWEERDPAASKVTMR